MNISFSGLASGLDTSSWVESLVRLKQAKVTTLQEQQEAIEIQKDALSSIKSFFNSFRATLSKITDTKFKNPVTDLFTQHLAKSSNIDVLTGIATHEAKEGTYKIKVNKLATNTAANSKYTTVVQRTTTANTNSKLTELGVNIADGGSTIGVMVDGVEKGINLTKSDTIGSFMEKLKEIGVESFYNEFSGIFSINIDDDAIIEKTANLRLKSSLHLKGVNEGYTTETLKITSTETVYSAATDSTKLSELGFSSSGNVVIKANDRSYTIAVNANTTLGGFIQALNNNNIAAELDSSGILTISDAEIDETQGVGLTLKNALGLNSDVYEKSQKTNNLTHTTLVTTQTTATAETLIKDLGEGVTIDASNNKLLVTNSDNVTSTITITNATKIGDLLQNLQNAGLSASISSDGALEISGGTLSGGILKELGLEETPFTAMVTGKQLQETIIIHKTVDLETRLVDDLKVTEGYLKVTKPDGTDYFEKIYSGQTIADFMADMGNLGINTSLDEDTGILTITGGAFETLTDADVAALIASGNIIEPDNRYRKGTNLIECLYGAPQISAMQTSVSSTRAKSKALTHQVTTVHDAELNTTLGTLGLSGNGTAIFTVRGENRTVNLTKNTTVQGLIDLLKAQGISASFDEDTHRFSVENATLTGGTSNLASVLDLTTSVSGKYKTSNTLYSKETLTIDATRDTILGDFGISNSQSASDRTVKLYNSAGTLLGSTVVTSTTTVGNLLDFIASKGLSANINEGVVTIHNGYIENTTLETGMGLEHSNKSSYVLGSVMTHTTVVEVTKNTTLGNIIDTLGTTNAVSGGYTLFFNSKSINVGATTTVNDLISAIYANGGTASIDSTGRLTIDGGTLTGTVAQALGMTSVTNTSSVSATGEDLYTTQLVKADLDTKLADLGLNSSTIVIHNTLGVATTTLTFGGSDTLQSVFSALKTNGIDATITDGVISLTSAGDLYITGNLADKFGITTQTVSCVVNTSSYSTAAITHTGTVTATVNTTLGEVNGVTAANQDFKIYRGTDGACIATITGLTTSSTIGDLFEKLKPFDIVGTIENGIIDLYSPSGNWAEGTIMTNLGIGKQSGESITYTVAKTTTSTAQITFTETVRAENADKISNFITLPGNKNITVYDKDHNSLGTIAIDSNTTFDDLFTALSGYGIVGSVHAGVISFTPSDGQYATGDVLTTLGINTTTATVTTTIGQTNTGGVISYTTTHIAEGSTAIGLVTTINSNATVTVKDSNTGATLGTFNVSGNTTFDEFSQSLAAYGITASIVDGVWHVDFNDRYIESTVLDAMGLSTSTTTTTVTKTVAAAITGTQVTYNYTITAKGETTLAQIGLTGGNINIINATTGATIGTVTTDGNTTFNALCASLGAYGITADITDGVFRVSSTDVYATGGPLGSLGIGTSTVTTTVSTTVTTFGVNQTGSALTYSATITAKGETTLAQIGLTGGNIVIQNAVTGATVATITTDGNTTFNALCASLGGYGITADITDGVFRVSSGENYATGGPLSSLGIGTTTATRTITSTATIGTASSGSATTYTYTTWATEKTTFAQAGLASGVSGTVYNAMTGATLGTVSVSGAQTFADLAEQLGAYGIVAGITDGEFFLGSNTAYIEGLSELGVSTTTTTITKTVTQTTSTTTIGKSETGTTPVMMQYSVKTNVVTPENILIGGNTIYKTVTAPQTCTGTTVLYVTDTTHTTTGIAITSTISSSKSVSVQAGTTVTVVDTQTVPASMIAATKTITVATNPTTATPTYTCTKLVHGTYSSALSGAPSHSITNNSSALSTAFHNMGITGIAEFVVCNFYGGGTYHTITVNESETLSTLNSRLSGYGISFSYSEGRLIVTQNSSSTYYLQAAPTQFRNFWGLDISKLHVITPGSRVATENDNLTDLVLSPHSFWAFSVTNAKTGETKSVQPYNFNNRHTFDNWSSTFSTYDIKFTFKNGVAHVEQSGDWYLSYADSEVLSGLGLNISGASQTATGTITTVATAATTYTSPYSVGDYAGINWQDIGITGNTRTVVIGEVNSNNEYTIKIDATTPLKKVEDLFDALQAYGIRPSVAYNVDGGSSLVLTPTGNYYIKTMDTGVANKLGFEVGHNKSYIRNTSTKVRQMNTSDGLYALINTCWSGYIVLRHAKTNAQQSIEIGTGTLAGDTWNALNSSFGSYGINFSFTDGKLTITPTGDWYVESLPSEITANAGFTVGNGYTYTTPQVALTDNDLIYNLLNNSGCTVSVTNAKTGEVKEAVITGNFTSVTINDYNNDHNERYLSNFGIYLHMVNGRLSIEQNGNWYISYMDSTQLARLGLNIGSGNAYSSTQVTTTSTYTDADRTLNQISGTTTGNQYITIMNASTNAASVVTISGADTISSIDEKLSAYGMGATTVIGDDGKGVLHLDSSGQNYITTLPNILSSIYGVSAGEGHTFYTVTHVVPAQTITQSVTANTCSGPSFTQTITGNANGNTLLKDVVASPANIVVKDGTNGNTYTINCSGEQTIDSMLASLAGYGISGRIADGVISLQYSDKYYISTAGVLSNFGLTPTTTTTVTTVTTSHTMNTSGSTVNTYTQSGIAIDGNTRLEQVSATGNITITDGSNGSTHTIAVDGKMTVDSLIGALGAYGIQATISGGVLSLAYKDHYYVSGAGALSTFGLGAASTTSTTVHNTKTLTVNTSGSTVNTYNSGNLNLGWDTQFSSLGLGVNSSSSIVLTNGATRGTATINVSGTTTLNDLAQELANYGISTSLDAGKVTLGSGSDWYVSTAGALTTYLKVSGTFAGTVNTTTTVGTTSTDGHTFSHTKTTAMSGDSTFGELGRTSGVVTIHNAQGVSVGTVTVHAGTTVNDFLTAVAGYGISGSISSDGKLTLAFGDEYYFGTDANTNAMLTTLGVTNANTKTTVVTTINGNTNSNVQSRVITNTMNSDTTLSSIGLTANATITVNQNGTSHTFTVTPQNTVNDLISTLAGYGISASVADGKLTINGGTSAYVSSMTDALANVLKLKLGENNSWEQKVDATTVNDDSNTLVMTKTTLLADGATVLNTIAGWNNGNGNLAVHQTNGQFVTISVNGSGTVDDFFRQIAQYGLVGTIGEDGRVTIVGSGNVYLQSVSGGSNILTSLKMSNVVSNVETITSNRTSDSLTHTITVTATGTTQLGELESDSGAKITFTGNNVSLVLTTTSDAGNNNVTLTFAKTSTIYDVINRLGDYGINASIDGLGVFSMSSSSLNDFTVSGTLGQFLMGSYTKQYGTDTTYNISTNLMQKTVVNMTDDTRLSELNVTNGNFEVVQEGVRYTLAISNTQTVGDFRNLLAQYGITSYIDDEGHLVASGIGETWLDSVSGGSNIITKFGLEKSKWTLGEITQTSDYLTDTTVIVRTTNELNKISELTNAAGTSLGITSGNIFIYQDGTRSTLYIDINDTLETLQSKLAQYGITMQLSTDGKLYFDGTNDTYMTNAASNSSNILDKIGASGSWTTRYDSRSQNLNYEVTTNETISRSTKLQDIQDVDGNNLGISNGTYYIYENGVRNTETITSETTVNDLMAAMATYGLISDIAEDGTIVVSGHNNSYMETSALAGANSNIVRTLFNSEWDFTNVYTSNHLDIPTPELHAITRETKLADIIVGAGEDKYKAGKVIVTKDGIQTTLTLTEDDTLGTFMDELALYGFEGVINDKGQLILRTTGDSNLSAGSTASGFSNVLNVLGVQQSNWINTNNYDGSELEVVRYATNTISADRDTALSDLIFKAVQSGTEVTINGVTTGEYDIYKNGVKYTAMISSDDTLGSLMDSLKSFGIETSLVNGRLTILGSGDTYVTTSASATNASNIASLFVSQEQTNLYTGDEKTSSIKTTTTAATEATKISELQDEEKRNTGANVNYTGIVTIDVNGTKSTLEIKEQDSIGDVLRKFRALGLEATISDGQILIQSGYDTLSVTSANTAIVNSANSLLKFNSDIGLNYDVQGFSASSILVKATKDVTLDLSAANYADMSTKLGMLNVSNGTLTVYRDGEKVVVNVDENDTFTTLQSKIAAKLTDVRVDFTDDGYLVMYSINGKNVQVGASTDSSNFSSITGITSANEPVTWRYNAFGETDSNSITANGASKSARELYCINGDTLIANQNGIFARGKVTTGDFIVGNATINIDATTTLSDIIGQINGNEASGAHAHWDNIKGCLVITANQTGASFVNIEAGRSNFTDIMGYTTTERNGDGSVKSTKIQTDTQNVGSNARFSINGTTYTSASNNIGSDISRITGVTINLKGVTENEEVELKIERDKETLALAVEEVVTSYNELMSNLEKELSLKGDLHKESTLKLIKSNLRSIMMSSQAGSSVFRNLNQIGILTSDASGNNTATSFDAITGLKFNKDAFLKAYDNDADAVKQLLCGGEVNQGVFIDLENSIERALSTGGYFSSAEKSFNKKISNLDKKIKKETLAVQRYRELLEKKFAAMDMLIAQMHQQYSTFLSS